MGYIYGIWAFVLVIWIVKTEQAGVAAGYNWLLPAGVIAAAIHAVYFYINENKKNSSQKARDVTDDGKSDFITSTSSSNWKINRTKLEPTSYGMKKKYLWEQVNFQVSFGDRKKVAQSAVYVRNKFVEQFGGFAPFMSKSFSVQSEYVEKSWIEIDSYDCEGCRSKLAGMMLIHLIVIVLLEDDPEIKNAMDFFLDLEKEFIG